MPIGKVLCLGGALTVGDDGTISGHRTYRGTLQNLLATAGLTLDFVGPNASAAAAGGSDPNHAGWVDASIDSTGSSSNNLTSRLSTLKTDFPSPDLIIIDPPWWDIVNAPTNLASRYNTFIGSVQSGAWASVKILMCTAHPASGQTAAGTGGTYSAYAALNAQIETTRAAASTTRFVADLAALTSSTTSASLTEEALGYAQRAPEFSSIEGGKALPNWQGGHLTTSFKSIQDFNAQWTSNPPRDVNGNIFPPPGGTGLVNYSVQSVNGGANRFVQSVAGVTPWYWIWCLQGHGATNSCVEVRNGFAAGKRIGAGWEFFFSGSRFGIPGDNCQLWDGMAPVGYLADGRSQAGQRPDGLTTWHAPRGNTGMELWPVDTVPSRGVLAFHGGFNRDLMANSECFWWGAQVRLALINPSGPDDRSQARFGAACGGDFFSTLGGSHYDRFHFPYNAQDGGHDAWTRITWTDWRMISAVTIGREGSPDTGVSAEYHWSDPGTPGPLANWSPPTPYNNPSAGRALTATQVRAAPLPIPPYWEGSSGGGTTSGYQVNDYWLPSGGSRLYLLAQSGADKIAGVMSRAIIASNALSSFTGGGVIFEPMPGLPLRPNVFLLVDGSSKVNVEPKAWDTSVPPNWQTQILPAASVGSAYSANLAAGGDPTPTYSIVSGAPAWLSVNSTSGALTGTPTGSATSHTIVFRASNSQGTADRTLTLDVVVGASVVTTSLPNAVQGQPYSQSLQGAGAAPFLWSISSGTLPAGLALAGNVIAGTPTTAATSTFTVQLTDALNRTATRSLSIVVGAAGSAPVITTTTLPGGTVGAAYSATVAATGTGTITRSIVSGTLPPGLAIAGSTGVISGTPTLAGGYAFTVRASSDFGFADAAYYTNIGVTATAPVESPWARFIRQ